MSARTRALVVVLVPRDVGRPVRRGPRRLERAADRLRDHVGAAREPGVLGERLDDLLLVGDLLEAVASGAAGLVGAVGVDHQRGLFLERVDHLADGVRHADHRGLHHDRRLARRLDVAGGHRRAGTFVRRQDVFELGPVDERVIERRVLAGGIAEHVFHAGGDELVGEGRAAGALYRPDRRRWSPVRRSRARRPQRRRTGRRRRRRAGLRDADGADRRQHALRGGHGDAGLGEGADELAAGHFLVQIFDDQLAHLGLPVNVSSFESRDRPIAGAHLTVTAWLARAAWRWARNRCRDSRPSA